MEPLTVKQLIQELQKFPEDLPVYYRFLSENCEEMHDVAPATVAALSNDLRIIGGRFAQIKSITIE